MMSETNKDAPRAATPPPVGDKPPELAERKDDSGVHDMKALAQTTKQRISRRITSQHDAYEESLLTSSQSGLRAVALPAPAQVVSLPAMPSGMPGADAIAGAEAAGITPIEAARAHAKKGKGVWIVAAGGVLAAAAAAVFVISSGAAKKDEQVAATAAGSGAVAMKDQAAAAPMAGEAIAQGAAAGSGAGTATTVVSLDPAAPPPPAEEAAKLETADAAGTTGANDGQARGGAKKAEGRAAVDSGSASRAGGGGAGNKAAGRGKDVKGSGGAGSSAGAGGGGAAPKGPGGDSMEDLLAAASGGAQKPTQGGDTGAAKPEKTGLDGKDIRSGMGAVAKQAQACFDSYGISGHVKIKATVDPSGKVTKADAQGEFAGTPTGTCVAAAARSASFPAWTGAPMTISYGFTLTE